MRLSRIAAVAVVLFGLGVAGGDVDAQGQCPKGKLRFYTSWPMQGAMLPEGTGMKNGVDMAVAEANGVAGGFCIEVVNLDDASPQTGKWDGAVEAENANKAVARSARHRLHRHVQLRRGQGLHPDQQPRAHGAGDPGQHLPRAHQEARGGPR